MSIKPIAAPRPILDKLAKLGLSSLGDLVLHLPLRYEDETRLTPLRDVRVGVPAQVEATIVTCEVTFRPRRQLVCRVVDDGGEELWLRFLNFYGSQQKQLQAGRRLRVFGEIRPGFFGAEMVHPRYRMVDEGDGLPESLTPVYPTTAGVSQAALRKLIDGALRLVDLADTLPPALVHRLALPSFADSVTTLHHPPPELSAAALEDGHLPAWRRLKFDELLAQQLQLRLAYAARRARGAPCLTPLGSLTGALLEALPFALTGAQERAWGEIATDLAAAHPMQRLLQGDVGSGKTIVAALAMLRAAENGWQSALMAPTEILAEQHYHKLAAWLAPLNIPVAWLSGSQKKKQRMAALATVASGETPLVVGTHALIEDAVEFRRLGLAIVDEQHRFGVRQRLALRKKGGTADGGEDGQTAPHQLMMSATPIPRTLAMSYYADLDVSVLDELPPGRTPVLTKLVSDARRDEVVLRVKDACAEGRQAYWVCPLIEESEALELQTAIDTHARLSAELDSLNVGLVHGRLKPAEKAAVMAAFVSGEVDLLVATTVIEVGVDVPNASLMVIEHAERFGLSQLHQLRGRVGRGTAQSACILMFAGPLGQIARERLKIMFETNDGFEVSRRDLELRGPGEFIGARQSGVPMLRFASLEDDADLLDLARKSAEWLLKDHPGVVETHLERWLGSKRELLKA